MNKIDHWDRSEDTLELKFQAFTASKASEVFMSYQPLQETIHFQRSHNSHCLHHQGCHSPRQSPIMEAVAAAETEICSVFTRNLLKKTSFCDGDIMFL
jgi:hypothetical protein